jgi:hypothetical protein
MIPVRDRLSKKPEQEGHEVMKGMKGTGAYSPF